MKKIIVLFLLSIQFAFADGPIWSKTGHRTIGEVAQQQLNQKTKKTLNQLLNGQSLAAVSNFADEIKADSIYRKFNAWHYANIAEGKDYGDDAPNKYGDLITAINECKRIIKDENSSKADKVFYLKMLVHFIGDLHQPMHIGRLEDKGGNDIQLQWFNKGTNLHKVWDSNMINDYGMSYTELAAKLPALNKGQVKAIQKGDVLDWIEESQEVADRIYDSVEVGDKLYYRYSYVWWDTVEAQLQKGGLRLAKVLNDLFS
ncbi:S1/P1 nuclease [Aurantibacter crassamenti]|uniref:S1/P1 nuclease n=1 Tax=Aurantibacter crassamenti TaxID=1837375 RepID=UPI00193A1AC9|nr:S1/P1 nuclease [Aurantibacter crassamenti]MBM1107945.1 S1/P1 nuclease [Aurantibacter crassamenti]